MAKKLDKPSVVKSFTFKDLAGTRIPGLRKFIKYRIEKRYNRARIWLFIIVVAAMLLSYNASYYVSQFKNQRTTISRTYKFPTSLVFPRIIMCTPTSYSFSRLDKERYIIPEIIKHLRSESVYGELLHNRSLTRTTIYEMLKLQLDRTVIDCKFQGRLCGAEHIQLMQYAEHACFLLDDHAGFSTNSTGRDGGVELLLNLNSYDGIDTRPGISGGLKIIFMHPEHMKLPHPHDIAYVDTGSHNSVSLVSKRRESVINCNRRLHLPADRLISMSQQQVLYYGNEFTIPCIMHNYYTTKSSAKLRSSVIFQKLTHKYRKHLQFNASLANQLKSVHVPEIRNRDFKDVTQMLNLTQNLIASFSSWYTPDCINEKVGMSVAIKVAYIRGKAEAVQSYIEQYLRNIDRQKKMFTKLLIINTKRVLEAHDGVKNVIMLNFDKNSSYFRILNKTAFDFNDYLSYATLMNRMGSQILQTMGEVNLFVNDDADSALIYAPKYYIAHKNLKDLLKGLSDVLISNKESIFRGVPFVNTAPVICANYRNTSADYDVCPEEVACPDFAKSYSEKYGMYYPILRDSMPSSKLTIYSSVVSMCFVGVMLKDTLRGYGVEISDAYVPWFDVFRLNEIATARWKDDKMFDRMNIGCRTFQACWRLVTYIATEKLDSSVPGNWHRFDATKTGNLMVKQAGAILFGAIQSVNRMVNEGYRLLDNYLQEYSQAVIIPFERMYSRLMQFRSLFPAVRSYELPKLIYQDHANSLIYELRHHLETYLSNSNLSMLATFMSRRGKILIGQLRIYVEAVQGFVNHNSMKFAHIERESLLLSTQLQIEPNRFLRLLNHNMTTSALSKNWTQALRIIRHTATCSRTISESISTLGQNTLQCLDEWLNNIQPLYGRAIQYVSDETLDDTFVKNNFVRVEIYYEDLSELFDDEHYPISTSALVAKFGAIGRFYMGLKIFNVAEFLGPIIIFILYRIRHCVLPS